jgi:hypothetical protein
LTFALARHGTATVPRPSTLGHRGGSRQRERAVEARRTLLEAQRAIRLDGKRMIAGSRPSFSFMLPSSPMRPAAKR